MLCSSSSSSSSSSARSRSVERKKEREREKQDKSGPHLEHGTARTKAFSFCLSFIFLSQL